MKLEKWEELESAQSAPLAAGMTDLKGSDIPGSSAARPPGDKWRQSNACLGDTTNCHPKGSVKGNEVCKAE